MPLLGGTVNRISWEGVYTFCRVQDTEALPHATAFEIQIHNDDGNGAPVLGSPVFSTTVPIEETNQTRLEEVENQPCRTFTNDSVWSWYSYEVALVDGPAIGTDGPIWVSIRAVAPGFDPFWGWRSAGDSATPSQQQFNGGLNEVSTGERVITVEVTPQ